MRELANRRDDSEADSDGHRRADAPQRRYAMVTIWVGEGMGTAERM